MKRIESFAYAAGLVIGLSLAACEDTAGPDPFQPIDSASIITVGHGVAAERFTGEVAVRGDFAYTSTWSNRAGNVGNAIKIWNVAGVQSQLVDSLIIADVITTGDVQISDDGRLLVVAAERANGAIIIYDLEDPAHPRFLSRHGSENTEFTGVHTVKLGRVNGILYAFLSVNPTGVRQGALVIVDLRDPAQPREVFVRELGLPYVHDVFVRDGLLFTALWHGGMSIWDIGGGGRGGSPEDPVLISNIRTVGSVNPNSSYVHNMWWFHNPVGNQQRYVFVGEEAPGVMGANNSGDVHVVDITDITQPREVAFYHAPGAGAHNFTMDEESGILYAAFYRGGVRAIDVRGDLGACAAAHRSTDGRCDLTLAGREAATALTDVGPVSIWGVARQGSFLYASDMLSGIFKLDISELRR